MHILTHTSAFILEKLALAGGGGSSSSSGSSFSGGSSFNDNDSYSSSGSSSTGGDPTIGIAIVMGIFTYLIGYYLGKLTKKLSSRAVKLAVTISFALAAAILVFTGISSGFIPIVFGITGAAGLVLGGIMSILFNGKAKIIPSKKARSRSQNVIDLARQADSSWNEQALIDHAKQLFVQYQSDWSTFNLQNIISYTTTDYARRAGLLLQALKQLERTNRVSNIVFLQSTIVDASDDQSAENRDSYSVLFEATATDELIDKDGTLLYSSTPRFSELWSFIRNKDTWLLSGITPATASTVMGNNSLVTLAVNKNMYYSLDMGWLLLPKHGVVVGSGAFGTSDINNHLIGSYNDHLYQLYTYSAVPADSTHPGMLIMQLTLPKSYGGIIVQRKQKFISATNTYTQPPKEYTQYSYGWGEFDDRYDVRATNSDQLTSFELINPSFMAFLYDHDPGVGIEVIDSTLYLFKHLPSQTEGIDVGSYEVMFAIAERAFKELEL